MSREAGVPEETAVSAACDAQRLRLLGPGDRWERARIFCSARTVRAFTCQASRGAPAWAPRRRAVLDASGGGAGGSLLTQGASSCEDNRVAFFQGRTALPGARRKAPSRQRAPQGHGRARGLMGLDERRSQLPHTDPLARSMRGPSIRTNDGLAMHGSTTRGLPTRVRSWGRAGVPLVTRRGQQALDRDCPHLQALGCAPWGMPGRDFLRVLPLLLTMEGAVHAQLFHGWSKVFPLKRQSDDLTVGVKHGDACRYRYQNVHREVEEVEQFFVSSHMKNAIGSSSARDGHSSRPAERNPLGFH